VIFALSNPDARDRPDVAVAAGAAFAGDGRSINNALAYPGIFKGALDVRASKITPEMLLAAAEAIAAHAAPKRPRAQPLRPRVHAAVRDAVSDMAREQGLANTAKLV
jgi:malate dehydrogenase (oxaloacetate-decarboxylating)